MNTSAKQTESIEENWSPCEHGELVGLNTRLRTARARQTNARVAGGAMAFVAAVLAIGLLPGSLIKPQPVKGGISCQQCLAAMPAYHDQLVAEGELAGIDLTAEQVQAVTAHLEACPLCRDHFEQSYPGALSGAAAAASLGWLALATRRRRG